MHLDAGTGLNGFALPFASGSQFPGRDAHRHGVESGQYAVSVRGDDVAVPGHRQRRVWVPTLCGDHRAPPVHCRAVGQFVGGVDTVDPSR